MKVLSVVETAIYVDDLDAAEDFYQRVLGLKVIAKKEGRHVFFQVGESNVLLAFNPKTTGIEDSTPHGAAGPGHFALGIEMQSLDDWRNHLVDTGVAIEAEVEWPPGGKSIYFRDPAGNSVELVTPGVWRLPSGWYSLKCFAAVSRVVLGSDTTPYSSTARGNVPANRLSSGMYELDIGQDVDKKTNTRLNRLSF